MQTADSTAASQPIEIAPELPAGKGAAEENFPVASWLISARHRPVIRAFYAFVRAADDIADHPSLNAEAKLQRLTAMEAGLSGTGQDVGRSATALALRNSLACAGISSEFAASLLRAFRQDAVKSRYRDWPELMGYCAMSADPVGRFLLTLHGEREARAFAASDALCSVLQILNHIQDCGEDYRNLDRVYLPLDWMADAGAAVEDLAADALTPAMRRVIDRMLDGCDGLLAQATDFARLIRDRRLAAEAGVIVALARRLAGRLRREDPLAARVSLSKADFASSFAAGTFQALLPRAVAGR